MAPIPTEGEGQSREQRSTRAAWLVAGLAAILVGYPLGFVLVAGEASGAWFTALYVALGALALAAAFGFARVRRGRSHGP